MAVFKKLRKYVSKARKGIRSVARKYVSSNRKYKYIKKGKPSTMGIAKAMSNLTRKLSVSAEHKTLDQTHTSGSADVALRQFFKIQASALESALSTTTTPAQAGYLLRQITYPSKGTGEGNYDGQKFSVESIQWKGTIALEGTAASPDAFIKMYIVMHKDNIDQPFSMSEFLLPDNNGEYSTASRRNRDNFKDYVVVSSRTYKLCFANRQRQDFNIFCRPKAVIRHNDGNANSIDRRFFCVAVASPDIAAKLTAVDYSGYTRMRFVH